MPAGTDPLRSEREPGRLRLGHCDQIGHRLRRAVRRHDEDVRGVDDERDRLEVLLRVVGQLRVERRVYRMRTGEGEQHRVAVGRLLLDVLGGDDAARPRLVVDDHRLLDVLGQALADLPRDRVGHAPRRERHDDRDRLGGEGLAEGERRDRGRSGAGDEVQNSFAGKHGLLLYCLTSLSSFAAFSFRISGRTSGLMLSCAKSASQRSGVMSG